MATVSFDQFVKKAGGKPADVTVVSSPTAPAPEAQGPGYFSRVATDIKTAVNSGADALAASREGEKNPLKAGVEIAKNVSEAAVAPITEAVKPIASAVSKIKDGIAPVLKQASPVLNAIIPGSGTALDLSTHSGQVLKALSDKLGNTQMASDFATLIDKHPDIVSTISDLVKTAGNVSALVTPEAIGAKIAPKLGVSIEEATQFVKDVVPDLKSPVEAAKTSLFGRPKQVSSIDDVLNEAESSLKADQNLKPSQILTASEKATAKPSLMEKWAGISPDIKNRIAGKYDQLKEYFDVAHARNNFDTLPTPLEHGAEKVNTAVSKIEETLNDTGKGIGQFRTKVATYEAPIDQVRRIEGSFGNQLSKLNLGVKNGKVIKLPGTVTRVGSEGDVGVLQDLYDNLQTVKQNPNLEKLIDLRTLFDSKINFSKAARDASSSLDPLSRTVRKTIADVGADIVGKSEAGNLMKYSNLMDAYDQLRSYTDRKAGAEFLLKQALSERGRLPREVINTVKEITGIDLMDDATMASIATDLIGNSRQKGLFRQELTKAGLDTAAALKGNPSGAIELMFNFLKKGAVNEEKQFLKAAK